MVGAGVVGLVTARLLEERGHAVRVIAAATGAPTVSAVAGAVWFPYRCGPRDRVLDWGLRTRQWLTILAGIPETGVDPQTGYEIDDTTTRPWWAENLDDVDRVPAPITGTPPSWRFATHRVEPSIFLPWLEAGLRHPIERRTVDDLSSEPGDVVIDCAGLAARELAADPAVTGLFGQILITEPGTWDRSVTLTDDRDPDATFYIIPRRDTLVVGGCSIPWPADKPVRPEPTITDRILDHARRLGISLGNVREIRAGLRPFRPEVRLERDPHDARILHCYGHGGAGYTLCRGCAEDLARLAR